MKKKIVHSLLFLTIIYITINLSSCSKGDTSSQATKKPSKHNNPSFIPEDNDTLIVELGNCTYYLDGESAHIDDSAVVTAEYDFVGDDDPTNVYCFSTKTLFYAWLNGKSYGDDVKTTIGNMENEIGSNNPDDDSICNKTNLTAGGVRIWDALNWTSANKYVFGFSRDLGSMKNKGSSVEMWDHGTSVFSAGRNFTGKRLVLSEYLFPYARYSFHYSYMDDNCESIF